MNKKKEKESEKKRKKKKDCGIKFRYENRDLFNFILAAYYWQKLMEQTVRRFTNRRNKYKKISV